MRSACKSILYLIRRKVSAARKARKPMRTVLIYDERGESDPAKNARQHGAIRSVVLSLKKKKN